MAEAVVTVERIGAGFIGWCTVHGSLRYAWAYPSWAAWDVLGHAAAHHGQDALPSE